MNWWDDKAARLQQSVRSGEADQRNLIEYDEQDARVAIVHTRQDTVMIFSQLSSANQQLRSIRVLLLVVVVLLTLVLIRL